MEELLQHAEDLEELRDAQVQAVQAPGDLPEELAHLSQLLDTWGPQ